MKFGAKTWCAVLKHQVCAFIFRLLSSFGNLICRETDQNLCFRLCPTNPVHSSYTEQWGGARIVSPLELQSKLWSLSWLSHWCNQQMMLRYILLTVNSEISNIWSQNILNWEGPTRIIKSSSQVNGPYWDQTQNLTSSIKSPWMSRIWELKPSPP